MTMMLDDAQKHVDFTRQCLSVTERISDSCRRAAFVLRCMKINALFITRNNMLIDKKQCAPIVLLCFDEIGVLSVDYVEKSILYYCPQNADCPIPLLVQLFVERMYPDYVLYQCVHTHRMITKDIPNWILCCWFAVISSKYKTNCKSSTKRDFVQKEMKDGRFNTQFSDMCWDLVSPKQYKDLELMVPSKSLEPLFDVLYMIVNSYCKDLKEDEDAETIIHTKMHISRAKAYKTICDIWAKLKINIGSKKTDGAEVQRVHISMNDTMLVHYKYTLSYYTTQLCKNKQTYVEDVMEMCKNKIYKLLKLRDTLNDLIANVLCNC